MVAFFPLFQGGFTLMRLVMWVQVAKNVPLVPLLHLTKRQEHKLKIARLALWVRQPFNRYCSIFVSRISFLFVFQQLMNFLQLFLEMQLVCIALCYTNI